MKLFSCMGKLVFRILAIDDAKTTLVAELKLKMSQIEQFFMFSISALPPEGAFQMFTHF